MTGQKPGRVNATDSALVSPTRSATSYKIAIARFVHNDRVIDALMTQAFRALDASPGARAYYDQLKPGAPTTTPFTIVGCLSSCWDVSQVVGWWGGRYQMRGDIVRHRYDLGSCGSQGGSSRDESCRFTPHCGRSAVYSWSLQPSVRRFCSLAGVSGEDSKSVG
jgi:hypothetical protein